MAAQEPKKTTKTVVVTKTFRTQDKDGKRVEFVASDKPQNLGEHTDIALRAGVALELVKVDDE